MKLVSILPLLLLAFVIPCGAQSLNDYKGKAADLAPDSVGEYKKGDRVSPTSMLGIMKNKDKLGFVEGVDAFYSAPDGRTIRFNAMVFSSPQGAKDALEMFRLGLWQEGKGNLPLTRKNIGRVVIGERIESQGSSHKGGPGRAEILWSNGSVLFSLQNSVNPNKKTRPKIYSTDLNDLRSFEAKFTN